MDISKELPQFNGIIICNQDLLTIDLLNQSSGRRPIINEKTAIMIIDEAHNLEEKVRNIRMESYNESKINSTLDKSTQIMSMLNIDYNKELEDEIDNIYPIFKELRERFIIEAADKIVELLTISKGKSLILFTSNNDMDNVYDILLQKNLPYKVLKQGQGGASHNDILERFQKDTNMVLLGSGSYSEGVNIPGESLSNLIIFKLPFPVPDPILEYKGSLVKNAFMEVYVPEMLIKLKQGVGRLIRGENDKGIVCILDPRLSGKSSDSYKKRIWDVLPIKNITYDIEELRSFYNQL